MIEELPPDLVGLNAELNLDELLSQIPNPIPTGQRSAKCSYTQAKCRWRHGDAVTSQ